MSNKQETLKLLDKLIEETKAMTPEEFADRERDLGVDKLVFNPEDYR